MSKIRYATFSECGNRRSNEDYCQFVIDPDNDRYLFVMADGMGGHKMGAVASQVVCTVICEYWEHASFVNGVLPVLQTAFHLVSKALDAKADILDKVEMGTTMVLAAIHNRELTIAHLGDSRCFFLRPEVGVVYQTKDHVAHNVWGDFIDRCFLSYNSEKAIVEIHQFEILPGDRVFLCTDGVCQFLVPDILTRRSVVDKSPDDAIDIIDFLCSKFSTDNYSGCLVYYGY